ncbi:MAG: hypothetical protein WAN65_28230 [Candidatus Sulfotelmatobacter sp.]
MRKLIAARLPALWLAAASLAATPAGAFTGFIISGPGAGGGGRQSTDYWVSCPDCTLYGYDARTGAVLRIGPLTGDSGPDFSYVVGSLNYDAVHRTISCICSAVDSDKDAAIYTVSTRTGKTVRKVAWDRKTWGVGETMISASPRARLIVRTGPLGKNQDPQRGGKAYH